MRPDRPSHKIRGAALFFFRKEKPTLVAGNQKTETDMGAKTTLDRDISWMYFNHRILQEAQRDNVPLLERLKFLGIYSNNLDEFFRVRVSTMKRIVEYDNEPQNRPASTIRELREIENLSIAEMASKTDVSEAEYAACEAGQRDLNFAFIYRCALAFNVDVTDIIQGSSPNLASMTVTRRGMGQTIGQAHGMCYQNMAASFRNRIAGS